MSILLSSARRKHGVLRVDVMQVSRPLLAAASPEHTRRAIRSTHAFPVSASISVPLTEDVDVSLHRRSKRSKRWIARLAWFRVGRDAKRWRVHLTPGIRVNGTAKRQGMIDVALDLEQDVLATRVRVRTASVSAIY